MNNENARILLAENHELEVRLEDQSFFIKNLQADLKDSRHATTQYAENYQSMVSERNDMVASTQELSLHVRNLEKQLTTSETNCRGALDTRNDTVVHTEELLQQVRGLEKDLSIARKDVHAAYGTINELLADEKKLVRENEQITRSNKFLEQRKRELEDKLDKANATAARQCTNILKLSSKSDERRDRVVHLESLLEVSKKEQVPFVAQERLYEMHETIVELEASCDRYQEQLDSYRSQPVRGSSTAANPAQDDWRTKSIMDPFLHVDPSNGMDFTAIENRVLADMASTLGVPGAVSGGGNSPFTYDNLLTAQQELSNFSRWETSGGNPAIQENLDALKASLRPHGPHIQFYNPIKETPMSNSTFGSVGNPQPQYPIFQTKNFLYGSDIETLTNDNALNVIQDLESELKQLNSMQTPSKVRTAMAEDITKSIANIVEVLDSRAD